MQFIMHFKEQLHLLHSLVSLKAKLPDTARLTFLQTTVESVPDLHHVQIGQWCYEDRIWYYQANDLCRVL